MVIVDNDGNFPEKPMEMVSMVLIFIFIIMVVNRVVVKLLQILMVTQFYIRLYHLDILFI